MTQYAVIRTSKDKREWIWKELQKGRLRQGWGWLPEQDLNLLYEKRERGDGLSTAERAAWRNRRMLSRTWNGLKQGDVVIAPNVPRQGQWVLMRVVGDYRYDRDATGNTPGEEGDFRHILPVELIRSPGKVSVVDPSSLFVDARLRGTMRTMCRIWGIDPLGEAVERLIAAIEAGHDVSKTQSAEQRLARFLQDARADIDEVVWSRLLRSYRGAEFEQLLMPLLVAAYGEGTVEHLGGPAEKGADFLVTTSGPLGHVFKTAIQAKLYDGTHSDLHSVQQLRWARDNHGVQAAAILTTAEQVSSEVEEALTKVSEELQISVRVWTRDDFVRLLLRYLGQANSVAE